MLKISQTTPKERRSKKAFIKSLHFCAAFGLWGMRCSEGLDEAHFKKGSCAGKNLKNHKRTFPMCRIHHAIEGNKGETQFWGEKLKDMPEFTDSLHAAYLNNNREQAFSAYMRFR